MVFGGIGPTLVSGRLHLLERNCVFTGCFSPTVARPDLLRLPTASKQRDKTKTGRFDGSQQEQIVFLCVFDLKKRNGNK